MRPVYSIDGISDANLLVLYTGNGRVGKIIGVAAAKTLTPISLEASSYIKYDDTLITYVIVLTAWWEVPCRCRP